MKRANWWADKRKGRMVGALERWRWATTLISMPDGESEREIYRRRRREAERSGNQ